VNFIDTVKPVLRDLCHERPLILNDHFPDLNVPAMNLTNMTSDHTKHSRKRCFHLLTVTGNDVKLRIVIGQAFST